VPTSRQAAPSRVAGSLKLLFLAGSGKLAAGSRQLISPSPFASCSLASTAPRGGIAIASGFCEIRVISENLAYLTLNLPKTNRRGERMPYEQKTTVQSGHGTYLERIWGFG
jgi:hypothetical protein